MGGLFTSRALAGAMLFGVWSEPQQEGLDDQSLKPLLENSRRKWNRPVVITYGLNNHAAQTELWRYILSRDAGE